MMRRKIRWDSEEDVFTPLCRFIPKTLWMWAEKAREEMGQEVSEESINSCTLVRTP